MNPPHTAVMSISTKSRKTFKYKYVNALLCKSLPSLQVGVANSRKQLPSPFASFTESVSNKGQTIAKRCESNALFTKVGQHSYQENAPKDYNSVAFFHYQSRR